MLRACLGSLAVLAALFGGYLWWLSAQFDPPGVYFGAAVMALVAGCSLGAVINSGMSYRAWSLLSAARHDLPWQDGRWTAVSGTIHPVAEAVIAPFSGEECVLCEYDVARPSRPGSSDSDRNSGSDFVGFLMNPCVVRTRQGDIKLLGFPSLEGFGERTLSGSAALQKAREFLLAAEFEDYSGLKMLRIVNVIKEAWNDEDGLVRKNARLTSKPPAELFSADLAKSQPGGTDHDLDAVEDAAEDDVEDGAVLEGDDADDDDGDDDFASGPSGLVPLLKERRVKVGDQVCAIGIYNAQQRGLVPGGLGADRFVKLVRGDLSKVEKAARSSTFGRLVGGLVGLVLVHAIAYGVTMANRHHPKLVERRQREAFSAVASGDIAKLAQTVSRGLDVNARNSQDQTLLSATRRPEVVRWLIEHGADVDARADGRTRLMDAAYLGEAEIVQVLIDSRANLELKTDGEGLTALDFARRNGREEVVRLLRAAGAREEVGAGVRP